MQSEILKKYLNLVLHNFYYNAVFDGDNKNKEEYDFSIAFMGCGALGVFEKEALNKILKFVQKKLKIKQEMELLKDKKINLYLYFLDANMNNEIIDEIEKYLNPFIQKNEIKSNKVFQFNRLYNFFDLNFNKDKIDSFLKQNEKLKNFNVILLKVTIKRKWNTIEIIF